MLIENNLFGTVDKIDNAIKLLREHEPPEGYFVCFSGGKDSTVAYHLVKRADVKYEAHHSYISVEPPDKGNGIPAMKCSFGGLILGEEILRITQTIKI